MSVQEVRAVQSVELVESVQAQASIVLNNEKLCVAGVIDFVTAVSLWEKSLPLLSKVHPVIFDFSAVVSANSAALALLIEWMKYGKREGKAVSFQQLPNQLQAIALMAGMDILTYTSIPL